MKKSFMVHCCSSWVVYSLLFTVLFLLPATYYLQPTTQALATEATPSSQIQSKLKALQEEIASKATQLKAAVNKKLQNRSVVGVLKSKSDSSLVIASKEGSKLITINEYTQYSGSGKSKITLKNLTAEDPLVALGDFDDTGVLTAKRVVKLTTQNSSPAVYQGQVKGIDNQSLTLLTKEGKRLFLSLTKATIYKKLCCGTVKALTEQPASLSEIITDSKVVIAMAGPAETTPSARTVYLLSSTPSVKTKTATPSATATPGKTKAASPSAKPVKK